MQVVVQILGRPQQANTTALFGSSLVLPVLQASFAISHLAAGRSNLECIIWVSWPMLIGTARPDICRSANCIHQVFSKTVGLLSSGLAQRQSPLTKTRILSKYGLWSSVHSCRQVCNGCFKTFQSIVIGLLISYKY